MTTKILINRKVLHAVSLFASTEKVRFYLTGVCVEVDTKATRYTATDGHTLVHYIDPHSDDFNPDTVSFRCTVPKVLCSKLGKDDFKYGFLTTENTSTSVEDVSGNTKKSMADMGVFPEYWRMVPDMCAGEVAQFNWHHMVKFSKFADLLSLAIPAIQHNEVNMPAVVTFGESKSAFGVIMPVRTGSPRWNKYDFFGDDSAEGRERR